MDKNKVVDLMNSYVKGINEKFTVEKSNGDMDISVEGDVFASFINFEIPRFCIIGSTYHDDLIAQTGIIQKIYTKACELLERLNEKKYTIQIFDNDYSFLYKRNDDNVGDLIADRLTNYKGRSYFTESEIEELKRRQGVAVDWNKAIIKEVEG